MPLVCARDVRQALELLAYEANMGLAAVGPDAVAASLAQAADLGVSGEALGLVMERGGRALGPARGSGTHGSASGSVFSPVLFCVLLSALSKLAARSPDVTPRVLLCFAKLNKVGRGGRCDRGCPPAPALNPGRARPRRTLSCVKIAQQQQKLGLNGIVVRRVNELSRLLRSPRCATRPPPPRRRRAGY